MEELPPIPAFEGLPDAYASLAVFVADLRTWIFSSPGKAAAFFGIDRTTIWRYENGKHTPPPGYLAALARLVIRRRADTNALRQALLATVNKAILFCYPDIQPFQGWDELEVCAEQYDAQRPVAGAALIRSAPPDGSTPLPGPAPLIDMGEAPDVAVFYGRQEELRQISTWAGADGCRLVAILGMGGIGKTVLAVRVVHTIVGQFARTFWRSLVNAPPFAIFAVECLHFLAGQPPARLPEREDELRLLLIRQLRSRRCLIILDNVESILTSGERTGEYREGYAAYGAFFQAVGEAPHQSCLLLTSREKPRELRGLERAPRTSAAVRSYTLRGMHFAASRALLADARISAPAPDIRALVERCSGNPKILELLAASIRDDYAGAVAVFLHHESIVFGDVFDILEQQFNRLSTPEQELIYWLAIERERTALATLREQIVDAETRRRLLEILSSLRERSLLEQDETGFWLQNAVMEYATSRLVRQIVDELIGSSPDLLHRLALMKAQTKDYLRASQLRLILRPIAEQLLSRFGKPDVIVRLVDLLNLLRRDHLRRPGYAAANLLHLFMALEADLTGLDLSHLSLWQACLQDSALPWVNCTGADWRNSAFATTFGSVRSVAVNADGTLLAAGASNGEVHLWRTADRTHLLTFDMRSWVEAVAFSPDGRILAAGGTDPSIRLWELPGGRELGWLEGHTGSIRALAFNHDGSLLASGSGDQSVRLWDLAAGVCLKILQGHVGTVWSVAFAPAGRILASAGNGIFLWDSSSGKRLHTLDGHTAWVMTLAFSPDGTSLASGSYDHTIKLWDSADGHCRGTLVGHDAEVRAVAFHPDGKLLASGSEDQHILIWDTASMWLHSTLAEQRNRVRTLAFHPDGHTLISGSHDQNIRLWDIGTRRCIGLLQGSISQVRTLAFHPSNRVLAVGVAEVAQLFDIESARIIAFFKGHADWVQAVVFSPDGELLFTGSDDHTIGVWRLAESKRHTTLAGHNNWVQALALAHDSSTLISGSADGTLRIWLPATGVCRHTLKGHTSHIWGVALDPAGRLAASASADQTVRLWDLEAGVCRHVLADHDGSVWAVAFAPGSKVLASAGHDRRIRLWDTATGRLIARLDGHNGRVVSVAIAPDGRTLVSSSDDCTVRLWDLERGHCDVILERHTRAVVAVAISADGRLLATGSEDGTVMLWDLPRRRYLRTLVIPRPYEGMRIDGATGLTEAQRGSLLALGATDGNLTSEQFQ